eukprot:gene1800-biopygen3502
MPDDRGDDARPAARPVPHSPRAQRRAQRPDNSRRGRHPRDVRENLTARQQDERVARRALVSDERHVRGVSE